MKIEPTKAADPAAQHDLPGARRGETTDRSQLLVQCVVDYAIFLLDTTGHVLSWNAGAERINQYSEREILGKHFSIFYPRAEVEAGKCDRELEIATREGRFEEEGWRLRKDGSPFWANVVITAVHDANGELIGFGKVTRDLTERREAQEALRHSEERLRLLISSVQDYAIFILDPQGYVTTWNPGAERLKGYTVDEIVGKHFSVFYPEADVRAGKCEAGLANALSEGRFEAEGFRVRKDGSRFWANVVITPIRDSEGKLLGFAKVTRDLSERKRHEEERFKLACEQEARRLAELDQERARALAEELRRARDRAEESARLKDDFLATVSHELRTPLNAILGWARMLQTGTLSATRAVSAVDAIVRNAVAQNQIVEDLLDVSRIVAGQLRLEVEDVDLKQVISASLDVVRPAADAKGVELEVHFGEDAGIIRGDAGRLQQVFWNVLSNAVKFSSQGGRVSVSLRCLPDMVDVQISDRGQGIDPAFLPRIFDRFSQENASRTRKAGGLGLGLAIVKHLVELHGGTAEAFSQGVGKGSTFTISIPCLAREPEQPKQLFPTLAPEELTLPTELAGLRVLIVDDEGDARELARTVFERAGAVVETVDSSAAALAAISVARPDVLVSDLGMPEEDGFELIRKVRALPKEAGGKIPAVALTAYARAEDRRRALLAGFQNHAAKPIEPQELLIVVANLVGR